MKNRKLLMIPGPIEFEPEVLRAMGEITTSHVAPNFIEIFGSSLELMRKIWLAPNGQPFIISGSGTLAMDMAACNLTQEGDRVLIISTGYFGQRYADIFTTYGAEVTILEANIGETVPLSDIEHELQESSYAIIAMTHVDTSTGVLVDPEPIAKLAQKYNILSILDGVCATAGEETRQEAWGIDIVLTGSQKAIGVPPGLALLVASEKAIQIWKDRKTPVRNYYADWKHWIPIMQAYEERRPSYFGTPAVNLINALYVSLKNINQEGIERRILRHQTLANAFQNSLKELGLQSVSKETNSTAHTMSAIYYPDGIDGNEFRKYVSDHGVIIAGGLHPKIKSSYFRVGHMGTVNKNDLIATLSAIEYGLTKSGYDYAQGRAVHSFLKELT